MPEIRIDPEVCKKDGLCVMACTVGIFEQKEKGDIPQLSRVDACIGCGHCVAICPHGALCHSDYPEGSVVPVRSECLPSYDQVLELIRFRRSKRRFEERAVERSDIEKVLDAARFAPSGHNAQPTEFVVIQDREALRTIARLTVEGLEKMMKPFKSPIGRAFMRMVIGQRKTQAAARMAPEMDGLAELFRAGNDLILNNAPTLIVFHADSAGTSPSVDANLALQNAALAAEALGLGCFYGGFVLAACSRDKSIPEFLSIPETHQVFGTLAMGYPRLKYSKWPERKPIRATWM